ncbi:MAG: hypothetical protein HYV42_03105 [Candidatus Magasanikbacteria bacterium]|nr:hypothetical protein [Candidatus Magasanikbacteria bacterium]
MGEKETSQFLLGHLTDLPFIDLHRRGDLIGALLQLPPDEALRHIPRIRNLIAGEDYLFTSGENNYRVWRSREGNYDAEKSAVPPPERFAQEVTANGVTIKLQWNPPAQIYELVFPNMDLEEAPADILNNVLLIPSADRQLARHIFTRARSLAQQAQGSGKVYQVYRGVMRFIRQLLGE